MSSALPPVTRIHLGAAVFVALLVLSGCVDYPVSSYACAVCGQEAGNEFEQYGENVTVDRSELHIHLAADGSARWVARVELAGDGVERLRRNDSRRRSIVSGAFERNPGPEPADRRNLTVRMNGSTLVVGFTDPVLAEERSGDLLLIDRFHSGAEASRFDDTFVRANRVVLHTPDGWTVLNDPPTGTTRSGAVVWQESISHRTYVVVGPERTRKTVAEGQVAVAAEVASWALLPWLGTSLFPLALLGGALVILLGRVDHAPPRDPDLGLDGELVGSVTVAVIALAAAAGVIAITPPWTPGSLWMAVMSFLGVPPLPFLAAGVFAHRRPAVRWPPAVVAAGVAPLVALWALFTVDSTGDVGGILLAFWAVVVALLGSLAFRIGREVSVPPTARSEIE